MKAMIKQNTLLHAQCNKFSSIMNYSTITIKFNYNVALLNSTPKLMK